MSQFKFSHQKQPTVRSHQPAGRSMTHESRLSAFESAKAPIIVSSAYHCTVMPSKRATWSLVLVLILLAVFIYKRWQEPLKKEAFDRHPSHIYYTKHAVCRMDCRHITKAEILEIMQRGIINFNKTHPNDKPCPTFALQGETSDGDKIRVIFAQCADETKVVTCYDLEKDFECHCPGDENKN